jgi:hypothetical protein
MTQPAPPSPQRPGRAILRGLLDVRLSLGVERAAAAAEDAVAQGLAVAKVYAFADSSAAAAPSRRSTSPGPPGPRPPGSTPPATSSGSGQMQPDPTASCSRPACSPPSTFHSPPAPPPLASATHQTPVAVGVRPDRRPGRGMGSDREAAGLRLGTCAGRPASGRAAAERGSLPQHQARPGVHRLRMNPEGATSMATPSGGHARPGCPSGASARRNAVRPIG